jgi:hypothetical protein
MRGGREGAHYSDREVLFLFPFFNQSVEGKGNPEYRQAGREFLGRSERDDEETHGVGWWWWFG